ncbi:MAG: tRNA preQ1(34) S-adenosylmethionine ribosyltransferase-isomerase QueA [Acidobacteria bacterium]|nr:MAG: tRNA preQ1(34) S-adenosylmethionine ribosyltransferase-isomerase QueA [Acidobacteriota bacterium]
MHISDFDYELPEELIAQQPLSERDASRMLVLDRSQRRWLDKNFASIPEYLRPHDVLVLNDTRVFPARLAGKRVPSGGAVELLLVREIEPYLWECLTRPARRLATGARVALGGNSNLYGEVMESRDNGLRLVRFESEEALDRIIDRVGCTPLPPYIKRAADSIEDRERYQTVYASKRGAIAAPTAGLHFTARLLQKVQDRGVRVARITLHVGYGTFEPVRVDDVKLHRVAPEWFSISEAAAQIINQSRNDGGRIVAVGTTTTRALESSVASDGTILSQSGLADLTMVPGYSFRAVDALLTNFHLPRSSLLLLVSAFAGRELTLNAYRQAVKQCYRFYSYGDCMLIL